MNTKKIVRVEHILDEENDRWVYIEYNRLDDIIGINFMFGASDYDQFKKDYCFTDEAMTASYLKMCKTFESERYSRFEFLSKCLWVYAGCLNNYLFKNQS